MSAHKIAYIGGIKSGKSRLAENKALEMKTHKPFYIATSEIIDEEMRMRIEVHKNRRQDQFILIEEPLDLLSVLKNCTDISLIDCLTLWINNMLYHSKTSDEICRHMADVLELNQSMIFVLNEVGLGVIPDNPLSREFVNISGRVSQLLGEYCEEVYFCIAGLVQKIK